MVWGTFFRDEVPQSARLSAGGGVQLLKGQCPNAWGDFLNGASQRLSRYFYGRGDGLASTSTILRHSAYLDVYLLIFMTPLQLLLVSRSVLSVKPKGH